MVQTRKAQAEGARAAEAEAEKANMEAYLEREVAGFTKMTTMLRSELEKRLAELNELGTERAAANEEKAALQRRLTDLERQVGMGVCVLRAWVHCLPVIAPVTVTDTAVHALNQPPLLLRRSSTKKPLRGRGRTNAAAYSTT